MTKYVIQSGGIKRMPEKAKAYFAELCKGKNHKPKFLWCFFATLPDPLQDRYIEYINLFKPFFPEGVDPQHECAQIDSFEEQVKTADIIYLHGGRVEPLMKVLTGINLEELFAGKTVGLNSASTLVFASHGWTCDERKCIDGLGIWPAKVGVHFYSDYGADDPRGPINWEAAKKELEEYADTAFPVYALPEGEFIIYEK